MVLSKANPFAMLYRWYNNAMYAMALRFYKLYPTQSMLNRLHLDYIHFGHGIDETNHHLPHTHLWDTLKVETVPLSDRQKTMYLFTMPMDHFEGFMTYGANARYHAHGLEGETVDHEIARIEHAYYIKKRDVLNKCMLASLGCLLAGKLLLLR